MSKNNGCYDFALNLYKAHAQSDKGNVFISPYSISAALSVVLLGAKNETATQLKRGLGFDVCSNEKIHADNLSVYKKLVAQEHITLELANQIFPDLSFTINPEFVANCQKYYETKITGLDFKSKPEESGEYINKWAESKTHGKIKDLLQKGSITSDVRLVLANAVYFLGKWEDPFKAMDTYNAKFYLTDGETEKVQMMSRQGYYKVGVDSQLRLKIIEIPYKGVETSMVILLPDDMMGLNKIMKNLTSTRLTKLLSNLQEENVEIHIPKMKFEYTSNLEECLKPLGIKDIFDPDSADLKGIANIPKLYFSEGVHKAFLNVDELGTEAAAVTYLLVEQRFRSCRKKFICDHPFLFFIKHDSTNSILFIGKMVSPAT